MQFWLLFLRTEKKMFSLSNWFPTVYHWEENGEILKQQWRSGFRQFPLRLDYGRSPHAYVNQRLQIQLELQMMSGMPLETCRAVNER